MRASNNIKIAMVGLEWEGVITKRNKPIRFNDPEKHWTDTYNCLAEVRSSPVALCRNDDEGDLALKLGGTILGSMHSANQFFELHGCKIVWDEMEIPDEVHKSIMSDTQFVEKKICDILTGEIEIKDANAYASDKFRGGGMHINVSVPEHVELSKLIADMAQHIPHPSAPNFGLPWRSLYRRPGKYRMVEYEHREHDGSFRNGFEYRSPCFSFTPLGIRHLFHVLQMAIHSIKVNVK